MSLPPSCTLSVFSSCFFHLFASLPPFLMSACRKGEKQSTLLFLVSPILFPFSVLTTVSRPISRPGVHTGALPFHTEACKLLSRHIKREKMLLFFFLRSVFRLSFLQPAPRRLHIQFPHLYLGPCEEQGDISAVLSGEDSHRLLSVLDVHSIYLTREREQNKIELMLDNQRGLYTEGQDSIKPLHPGNSSSLELQR